MLCFGVELSGNTCFVPTRIDSYPLAETSKIDCVQTMQGHFALADVQVFGINLVAEACWNTDRPQESRQQMRFRVADASSHRQHLACNAGDFLASCIVCMRDTIPYPLEQHFGFLNVRIKPVRDFPSHMRDVRIVPVNHFIRAQVAVKVIKSFCHNSLAFLCSSALQEAHDLPHQICVLLSIIN